MKRLIKSRYFRLIMLVASVIFAVLGFLLWKPLLIGYHRNAMVTIWQTELGITHRPGPVVSVRRLLGLPMGANYPAATRALSHREALLKLGYFTKRKFTIHAIEQYTPAYRGFIDNVPELTGWKPTAEFDYDQSLPPRLTGLIVYATAREMPQWEQFISSVEEHHK
jgi:hypothetical protein